MSEFLDTYLQRRFAMDQMRIEWGYNLHDACQRFSHDENIGQFWGVLEGNVSSGVGTFCLIKELGQKFAKECLCYFFLH